MFSLLSLVRNLRRSTQSQSIFHHRTCTTPCLTAVHNLLPHHREPPVKITRAAQRKAAKAARLEKQQQQQQKRTSSPGTPSGRASPAPANAPPILPLAPPPELTEKPHKASNDAFSQLPAPIPISAPAIVEEAVIGPTSNGHMHGLVDESATAEHVIPAPPVLPKSFRVESNVASVVSSGRSSPILGVSELSSRVSEKEAKEVQPGGDTESQRAATAGENEQRKKRQNMLTRTLWTFIMTGGFVCTFPYTLCPRSYKLTD
jgi:phosphatidate cytidylyltransferase